MKIPIKPTEVFSPPNPKFIISAFGLGLLKPKFYKIGINAEEESVRNESAKDTAGNDFGLPVFDRLVFAELNYEREVVENGKYVKQNITIPQIDFEIVLIDVSQSKNIVSTPISGRNGTVKEYISDGDYMINIKGVLVGKGVNVVPEQDMVSLINFCKAPKAIDVVCDRFISLGIASMVIKEYNFGQIEGQKNVVPFELICLSDTAFEISQNQLSPSNDAGINTDVTA